MTCSIIRSTNIPSSCCGRRNKRQYGGRETAAFPARLFGPETQGMALAKGGALW